jgi:hypothetical protein
LCRNNIRRLSFFHPSFFRRKSFKVSLLSLSLRFRKQTCFSLAARQAIFNIYLFMRVISLSFVQDWNVIWAQHAKTFSALTLNSLTSSFWLQLYWAFIFKKGIFIYYLLAAKQYVFFDEFLLVLSVSVNVILVFGFCYHYSWLLTQRIPVLFLVFIEKWLVSYWRWTFYSNSLLAQLDFLQVSINNILIALEV